MKNILNLKSGRPCTEEKNQTNPNVKERVHFFVGKQKQQQKKL